MALAKIFGADVNRFFVVVTCQIINRTMPAAVQVGAEINKYKVTHDFYRCKRKHQNIFALHWWVYVLDPNVLTKQMRNDQLITLIIVSAILIIGGIGVIPRK